MENQIVTINRRNKELTASYEELQLVLINKDKEIETLNQDLIIVTQKSDSYTKEIERLNQLNAEINLSKTKLEQLEIELHQKERNREQHLSEVILEYKACLAENESLKKQLKEFELIQMTEIENYKQIERDLIILSTERVALFERQKEYLEKIGALQHNTDELNKELELTYLRLKDIETRNSRLLNEHRTAKKVSFTIDDYSGRDYHKLKSYAYRSGSQNVNKNQRKRICIDLDFVEVIC